MFSNFGITSQLTDAVLAWCHLSNNKASFEIINYFKMYTAVSEGSLNRYWDELGQGGRPHHPMLYILLVLIHKFSTPWEHGHIFCEKTYIKKMVLWSNAIKVCV